MRSVLIISDQSPSIDKLRASFLDECSVFIANSNHEALDLVRSVSVDLVFMEPAVLNDEVLKTAAKIKSHKPSCVIVCLLSSQSLESEPSDISDISDMVIGSDQYQVFDFFIRKPILITEAKNVIKNAFEKQQILQELACLKEATARNYAALANVTSQPLPPAPDLTPVLTAMAKTLSTSFNLDRLMNLFLEIVAEMLRLNRASLAIYDSASGSGEYRIKAQRGLLTKIVPNLKLKAEDALPSWMVKEGRLITKAEAESMLLLPAFRQINSELEMLQAVASIPLLAGGKLVGILNIGPRVTGIPYANSELETLFILASHVAVSIQDIKLYHQVQYQKTYIENILVHMSSGVITINLDEKVVIYNRGASEILKIPVEQVINKDLRTLPSPLGDILFETLRSGKRYQRLEIKLALGNLPLEVSTYRIEDEDKDISGSVMVFEDLSQRKQLEQERRRSIELDLLNRIMATMAHEIKNPLVSIRTFVELLSSRFDDPDFRNNFYSIIQNDIRRLDELVEKMVSFGDTEPHNFELGDIESLLNECVIMLKNENADKSLEVALKCQAQIPSIRYDKARVTKAFLYIMRYLVRGDDSPSKIEVRVSFCSSDEKGKSLEIEMKGNKAFVPMELSIQPLSPISEAKTSDSDLDLGLSVSQRIIEEHGGHLEVTKSDGGKLAFLIQIPVST